MAAILNHNIPAYYFAAFSEPAERHDPSLSAPSDYVWINSKRLYSTWKRITSTDLLSRLKSDDLAELVAEKLSSMGTNYRTIVKKIPKSSTLDRDELSDLSFLILNLLTKAESPKYRKTSQEVDAAKYTWEGFESAVFGAEAQAKRTRSSLGIPEGDLLDHGMHFILNRTGNPFVTSDRAILVDSLDPQEAKRIFGALDILDADVSGGIERVIVLPVSPEAAVISSSFIERGYQGYPYIECSSVGTIYHLNLLTCYGADRTIISSKDRPFGGSEDRARDLISRNSPG